MNRIEASYFPLHLNIHYKLYEVRGSGRNILQGTGQIRRKLTSSCHIDRSLEQYVPKLDKLDVMDVWVTSTIVRERETDSDSGRDLNPRPGKWPAML